jgi:hypothetical protein
MAIGKSRGSNVGVVYDSDVARRNNLPPRDAKGDISITYDKDIATRNNMPPREDTAAGNQPKATAHAGPGQAPDQTSGADTAPRQ